MPRITSESLLPVLSRGRHRHPRQGACFMEYASYLAGQRWSDHPSCTHPSLAALARLVNDVSSDRARSRLTPLIPSVVGLTGTAPLVPLALSVLAASEALLVASEGRQRALASGLLRCARMLEGVHGPVADRARDRIDAGLASAPGAQKWAREFEREYRLIERAKHLTDTDEGILRVAVIAIAEACTPDTDDRLLRLLTDGVTETIAILRPHDAERPAGVPVPGTKSLTMAGGRA